jgi:hypothetical protein
MNRQISIILLFICFWGCNKHDEEVKLPPNQVNNANPELNLQIGEEYISTMDSKYKLMIAAGQISPSYDLIIDSIRYTVTVNGSSRINFISTSDSNFVCPENLKVNQSLREVLATYNGEIIKERGWAYYIKLPSGWHVAFTKGNNMTNEVLDNNDKIKWFFKR